ncbi:Cupredoxin [Trametes elegans]|nr:Cupredoxin [Trametes elegans]
MRFSTIVAALLPVGAAFAQTTHTVKVGANGGLTYEPSSITAANGDTIQFQFLSKNHTVTQSTFAAPCSNVTDATGLVTGVDSGYLPVAAGATEFPVWSITVNNASTPLWFYCRQGKHCQAGMVFAVNPTADKTFDAFKAAAAKSDAVDGSKQSSTGGAAASGASGTGAGASGTGSASGAAGTAAGATPSPSAAANNNGAGAVQFGASALFMTLAGLSAGLLL